MPFCNTTNQECQNDAEKNTTVEYTVKLYFLTRPIIQTNAAAAVRTANGKTE